MRSVCWAEGDEPWIVEEQLISTLSLPLNLDQNARHPLCFVLKAIRQGSSRLGAGTARCALKIRFRPEVEVYRIHMAVLSAPEHRCGSGPLTIHKPFLLGESDESGSGRERRHGY
jgi:hypothetical protein